MLGTVRQGVGAFIFVWPPKVLSLGFRAVHPNSLLGLVRNEQQQHVFSPLADERFVSRGDCFSSRAATLPWYRLGLECPAFFWVDCWDCWRDCRWHVKRFAHQRDGPG